jgi:hypothetical protein
MAKEQIQFTAIDQMNLPETPLEMYEALALLERENLSLLAKKEQGRCVIHLLDKKNKQLMEQRVAFPIEENIEEVLTSLLLSPPKVIEEVVEERSEEEVTLEEVSTSEHNKRQSRRQRKVKGIPKRKRVSKSLVFLVGVSAFSLVAFSFGLKTLINGASSTTSSQAAVVKEETWETLLSKGKYEELAKNYPNKIKECVNTLTKEKKFEALEKFNQIIPTPEGEFDLAFYHGKWSSVVESPVNSLNDERKVMLAHAFLEMSNVEEASILNEKLQSEQLKKEIKAAKRKQAVSFLRAGEIEKASELQKELKDKQLEEWVKDAQVYQEMIDLYVRTKEKDKEDTWRKYLRQIGEE